jgi:small-conductance mechanosensitive channel
LGGSGAEDGVIALAQIEGLWQDETSLTVLGAVGFLVTISLLLEVLRRLLLKRTGQRTRGAPTNFSELAIRLLAGTQPLFILVLAFAITVQFLDLPLSGRIVRATVLLALLVQLGLWGNATISFWLARYSMRHSRPEDAGTITTMYALGIVGRIVLWAVLVLFALANFGVNVTALIAGLGIGGVAVALALQNILGDLFGALSIALDKPFIVGDLIEVDTFIGRVEHIGLKTTRLRSVTGEQIVIANSDLLRSRIRNYRHMRERRETIRIRVPSDIARETLGGLAESLRAGAEGVDGVKADYATLREISDGSVEYELAYHVPSADPREASLARERVHLAVLDHLTARGITPRALR